MKLDPEKHLTDENVRALVNGALVHLAFCWPGFAAAFECQYLLVMLENSEPLRRGALRYLEQEWPDAIDWAYTWASSCRHAVPPTACCN